MVVLRLGERVVRSRVFAVNLEASGSVRVAFESGVCVVLGWTTAVAVLPRPSLRRDSTGGAA